MKITAIVGTYRKGGVIDSVVDEILTAAKEHGAEVEKVFLLDQRVEFCTNCRSCTQQEGTARGTCCLADDMAAILDRIDASDGLILASPMNFGTVTALMKRFIERLVCYGYWPWGRGIPKERIRRKTKRAVVVASSAAPAVMGRWLTGIVKLLKSAARLLGARNVETLFIGLVADQPKANLRESVKARARKLGQRLASA
ncbi:MAG: flavodoxin family protein [Thermoguttaceae bacterium]